MSHLNAFFADNKLGFQSKLMFGLIHLDPVAIGNIKYPENQSECAIAIGKYSGLYTQGDCAIAIGESSGQTEQGMMAIAIGAGAGSDIQSESAIAIGVDAGASNQSTQAIAIGMESGKQTQGGNAIAIGTHSGQIEQQNQSVSIGTAAGQFYQRVNSIAIGSNAGQNTQGPFTVAIGSNAGQNNQGLNSIAIGSDAGVNNQGLNSIAIGDTCGSNNQASNAIAIGRYAGLNSQRMNSIAIGESSGLTNQGVNAIAIGNQAGKTNQPQNSIVLNASGIALSGATASACYINPIRLADNFTVTQPYSLVYNTSSKEVMYQPIGLSIGDLKFSVRAANHDHWILCNGASYLITDYPKLFAIINYSFGGSGASFNVPDARSRVLGAIGQGSGLSDRTLGQAVGAETHTLTTTEMPSHNHGITDPGHTHTYLGVQSQGVAAGLDNAAENSPRPTETSGTSTTGITINNTGGGQAHNNMQPTLFVGNVFIYAGY
jgi:microcystin-dependent protein